MAGRMGYTEEVFSASEQKHISWLLDSGSPYLEGITLESLSACRPLRANIPANPYSCGFLTPSGKVEFYSEDMAAQGLDPLPSGDPSRDDDHGGEYPLQLIHPAPQAVFEFHLQRSGGPAGAGPGRQALFCIPWTRRRGASETAAWCGCSTGGASAY